MPKPVLTKTKFCYGLQCLRQLWRRVHEPSAPELTVDPATQLTFDHGTRVGELARERFPGGVLVDYAPWFYDAKCRATRAAIDAGANAIFEASFVSDGVFVAVDILERQRHEYCVVEVKSSTKVKSAHYPDVAIQLYVLRAAGIRTSAAHLMHLNRECRYPDLANLFARADLTEAAEALQGAVSDHVGRMKAALAGELPDIEPGTNCAEPYECPFRARCWPTPPEHHVGTLYRIGKRARELEEQGIATIHELPPDFACSGPAERQIRSVKSGHLVVEPTLSAPLGELEPPIAFLDFETVALPVPIWDGCAPYDQVPVQMSCHVLDRDGSLEHHEYLAEAGFDPRPGVAHAVVSASEKAKTVLAYNASFESGCIKQMAEAVPSLAPALLAVQQRLVDLLPIVRDHVYHPAFGGSFSIKSVLPALVPGTGYEDLEVKEGGTAQAMLETLLLSGDSLPPGEKHALSTALLAYCERDTYAMVKLLEVLRDLADGGSEAD